MARVIYSQDQLDTIITYLNSLELAVGKNVINAQRVMTIFDTMNAGKVVTGEEEATLKSLAANKEFASRIEVEELVEEQ